MKHLVFMGDEAIEHFVDNMFRISHFNPTLYLPGSEFTNTSNLDLLLHRNSRNHHFIRNYHILLDTFAEKFLNVDVIVANWFNPFHPEWLIKHFPYVIKIYGCIDDPSEAYQRRISCLWAFDAAFYISPSYDQGLAMTQALRLWGINHSYWWPLSINNRVSLAHCQQVEASWHRRTDGVIYVGNLYGPKFDRLVKFKRRLGKQFSIYGRWPFRGFAGFFGPLRGRNFFPYRVKSISNEQRQALYLKHKIGLNMHLSDYPRETGNMRMYEVPFHGMMLLCDKAADGWHESIFKPDVEAVFYDDIEDAADKAIFYLKHDGVREKIARAGFDRVCRDYDSEQCLKAFLEWAINVPLKTSIVNEQKSFEAS